MRSTFIDTATIIAVGSELLTPYRADSNSLFLTGRLNDLAIEVQGKVIVGDDQKMLAVAIERGLNDADLIVMTGGLGPTDDDITRDTLATVLNAPLVERQEILSLIQARFAAHKLKMPEINRRQALVPRGAEIISNGHGTAPGRGNGRANIAPEYGHRSHGRGARGDLHPQQCVVPQGDAAARGRAEHTQGRAAH